MTDAYFIVTMADFYNRFGKFANLLLPLEFSKFAIVPIFNGIACILMFTNASINHKKITVDNKE